MVRTMYALLALGYAVVAAVGVSVNGTIDDQLGDQRTGVIPSYLPNDIWTQGAQCASCYAKPDPSQVYDHTWHDATILSTETRYHELNVTMNFTGTAVYAYCILINVNNDSWPLMTNLSFSIDGNQVGSYFHASERTNLYTYNQLVYGNASVPNGNHVFMIHLPISVNNSYILFDYVQYTYDDTTSPTSPPTKPTASGANDASSNNINHNQTTKVVVAAVVAGTAALTLFLACVFFAFRRRRRRPSGRIPVDSSPMESSNIGPWSPLTAHAQQLQQQSPDAHPFDPTFLYNDSPHAAAATALSPLLSPFPSPQSQGSSAPMSSTYADVPPVDTSSSAVTEQSQHHLLHQLEGRQQRLSSLRQSTSAASQGASDTRSSRSAVATQSEVEELRQEIARLRKILTDTGAAPPQYDEL